MPRTRHLLILLPGVMGSVLQKDGKDVWALSGQALWTYISTLGKSLDNLRIAQENWQADDLGDGITATRLIDEIYAIPNVMDHAGYKVIVDRIKQHFDNVQEGTVAAPRDADNFFTFPYDWRRDNRVAARKLQVFIDQQLPRWRKHSGAADAQVILIGHSMGGLISRYYVEVLEGWRNCRALITVGSPHRGALAILNGLCNGVHDSLPGLTAALRSFEPAYQLLPAYPCVRVGNEYKRVVEMDALPNVDLARARAARTDFLEAIKTSAERNTRDPAYHTHTYLWLGVRQRTKQSVEFDGAHLTLADTSPTGLDDALADGDGTVPHVSATPVDLDDKGLERFVVEQHGWLTNNPMALNPLLDTLAHLAASNKTPLWGIPNQATGVSLQIESVILQTQPATATLQLAAPNLPPQEVRVQITSKSRAEAPLVRKAKASAEVSCAVEFGRLKPGLYVLTASTAAAAANSTFEVIDSARAD